MVLALALVIAALVDLEDHGIAVVGEVEGGLPSFGLPGVGASDFVDLVLPAAAFSLVAFADLDRDRAHLRPEARLRGRRQP